MNSIFNKTNRISINIKNTAKLSMSFHKIQKECMVDHV